MCHICIRISVSCLLARCHRSPVKATNTCPSSQRLGPPRLLGDAAVLYWGHCRACCLPIRSPHRFRHRFLRFRLCSPDRQQQGIRSIGAFLASASELRVLWSAPYLQRLWCVFELAAYRKLNPNGRIVISRIMTEVAVLLTFIWAQLGTVGFWLAREGPHGGELWRLLLVVVCVGWRVLAAMALAAVQKQDADEKLRSLLTNFDVMNAKCSNEFDRQCIHDLITTWYGSLDAFNDYIRGPFCLEVLQLRRSNAALKATTSSSCCCRIPVTFWKAFWLSGCPRCLLKYR